MCWLTIPFLLIVPYDAFSFDLENHLHDWTNNDEQFAVTCSKPSAVYPAKLPVIFKGC